MRAGQPFPPEARLTPATRQGMRLPRRSKRSPRLRTVEVFPRPPCPCESPWLFGGKPPQRISAVFVQRANGFAVEALLLDLEIGSGEQRRRQFLDCKAHCFGRGCKAPIGHRTAAL